MIAACPKCAARYRIDRDEIGENGVRLRCSRCESVFRVRAPEQKRAEAPVAASVPAPSPPAPVAAPAPVAPVAAATPPASAKQEAPAPPVPQATAPASAQASEAAPPHAANADPEPLGVLIAIPDPELAKAISTRLTERGAVAAAVFDGVDAMLEIQRRLPKAVVLAADLPKMFGFQVCEVVKRNESLHHIHVVLAGAVHHPDRYRRSPSELYGADDYVEAPDLPEGLLPILARIGVLDTRRAADLEPASAPEPPAPAPPKLEMPEPGGLDLSDALSSDSSDAGSDSAFQTSPTFEPGLGAAQGARGAEPAPSSELFSPAGSDLRADPSSAQEPPAAPPSDLGFGPSSDDGFGRDVGGGLDGSFVTGSDPAFDAGSEGLDPSADVDPRDLEMRSSDEPPAAAPAPAPEFSLEFDEPPSDVSARSTDASVSEPDLQPDALLSEPDPFLQPDATPTQAAPASPAPGPKASEGRAQAERLARIIVSDIVLYNEEKFAAAVQAGNAAQVMAAELDEGRALFTQRIDAQLRGETDFLTEELLRVARARGMK